MRVVHVEVARKASSTVKKLELESSVWEAYHKDRKALGNERSCAEFLRRHPQVADQIQSLRVFVEEEGGRKAKTRNNGLNGSPAGGDQQCLPNRNGEEEEEEEVKVHVYDLNSEGEEAEYMEDDEEQSAASHHWILPSASFEGLWDSLVFDHDVQSRLLKYIDSALLFAEKGVDTNLISWNKVVLLHGPAGTGKTSLCKAIAQKAAIRLGKKYLYAQLIEINSHSLFSKWFSESGKLVMKMFEKIHELIEDPKCLVFLLIDEVESLAQCRQSAEAGNEPTDSIRAVNALLTQIDRIKRFPNVIILTTSNMVGCIDLAFVDRADLKIFIGTPPAKIVCQILASSVNELIRVGIINSEYSFPTGLVVNHKDDQYYESLMQIARLAMGLSGRTLRKLPFIAHSIYNSSDLASYLNALKLTVERELKERSALNLKSGTLENNHSVAGRS